ncbi:MAG: hypothetical protein LBK61_00810 [Spirochaetaceae bacterium]|jgi:hypothetical protein|nr:hypothetical protein [Spirochaetaceae bacterium]
MEKKFNTVRYFWQIVYAHTISYFVAGIFALVVLNYRQLFAMEIISSFMRSVDEPIVALGLFLQVFRGIIIGLALLPLRKVFFEEKNGLIKLGILIIGLSLLSTIGPTIGSFEGYIFTKIPAMYQVLGYPEAIIYVLLFIGILGISKKYEHKKIITILSIIFMILIGLMGFMGYMMA